MKTKLLLLLMVLAVIAGCKDDNSPSPTGLIYSYYPTNVGHEIIYDVTLITKSDFNGDEDTAIYQIKELIESTFEDNQGRPTQRLERYTRNTPADPWVISEVWTSNLTAKHLERKEENITYVNLVFPMLNSVTWNGNGFNTLDEQSYSYLELHQPLTLNGMSFDSTATVLRQDDNFFTETIYDEETFANHVGIVYKRQIDIKWDNTFPNNPTVKSQRLYTQTIVSYSN